MPSKYRTSIKRPYPKQTELYFKTVAHEFEEAQINELNMSFFKRFSGTSKGFSPKRPTARKKAASLSNLATLDATQRAQEFGLDFGPAQFNVSGTQLKFEDGEWQAETGSSVPHREVVKLRKDNQKLMDENNMLKLKIDILLDMLAESTAECHVLEKEKDALKFADS